MAVNASVAALAQDVQRPARDARGSPVLAEPFRQPLSLDGSPQLVSEDKVLIVVGRAGEVVGVRRDRDIAQASERGWVAEILVEQAQVGPERVGELAEAIRRVRADPVCRVRDAL